MRLLFATEGLPADTLLCGSVYLEIDVYIVAPGYIRLISVMPRLVRGLSRPFGANELLRSLSIPRITILIVHSLSLSRAKGERDKNCFFMKKNLLSRSELNFCK